MFIVATMSLAGVAHALWMRSKLSLRFGGPVDFDIRLRGRRIFGPNKMWRGFVVMPPAAGLAFCAVGSLRPDLPAWFAGGMWALSPLQYAALGFACGFAFMLAELPNSFVKRQLNVAPGLAPHDLALAAVFFIVDRVDSVLGVLIVLTAALPIVPATWAWMLLLGPGIHWLFSLWLYRLKVKARPF